MRPTRRMLATVTVALLAKVAKAYEQRLMNVEALDIVVMLPTLAFSLILLLLSELGTRAGWKMLGLFGASIAFLCALVLVTDGDLTNGSNVIASANGNFISDFNLVSWVPTLVGLGESFVTVRKIFRI